MHWNIQFISTKYSESVFKLIYYQISKSISVQLVAMFFFGDYVLKNLPKCRRHGIGSYVRKILWSRKWQPALVRLPGESHG